MITITSSLACSEAYVLYFECIFKEFPAVLVYYEKFLQSLSITGYLQFYPHISHQLRCWFKLLEAGPIKKRKVAIQFLRILTFTFHGSSMPEKEKVL